MGEDRMSLDRSGNEIGDKPDRAQRERNRGAEPAYAPQPHRIGDECRT